MSWRNGDPRLLEIRVDEWLPYEILRNDGVARCQGMVARQHDDKRFPRCELENQIRGVGFSSKKCCVELSYHESCREIRRVPTAYSDLNVRQLVPKDSHRFGKPVHLLSGEETQRE